MSVIEREDWRSVIDLVSNAKQVVSMMQDGARKLADYAKFRSKMDLPDEPTPPNALGYSSDEQVIPFCKDGFLGFHFKDLFLVTVEKIWFPPFSCH